MSDERTECAESLERLAADPRFNTRAADLRSLAAAVQDQGDGTWTGIDLIGAFPPEASINVDKQHWLERFLGIAAGASVFLPVAWTWWSIYHASGAYQDLIVAGDEAGRTFLGMWTTGFDGRLDGVHEFGPTAMVAFTLVAIAVLLVVANRWVSDHYMFREERSGGDARRDLVAVLGRAQRFLNIRRTDDPRFLEEALKRSVAELNEAHVATREGVQQLRDVTAEALIQFQESANKVLEDLRPLLQSADEASRTFAKSADSAAGLQEKVLISTDAFDKTLRDSLTSFQESVKSSSGVLAQSSHAAATTLTTGVSTAVAGLADGVQRMENVQESSQQLLEGGFKSQSKHAEESRAASAELQRILEAHESAIQGQGSELSRAADLAGQLLDELRSQAR